MAFARKNSFENDNLIDASFDDEEEIREEEEKPEEPQTSGNFGGLGAMTGSSIELKVVRPETFRDVLVVANHLLAGRTVVIDFETANRDTVKRIKDFLGGVAYSINGQLQKVANNTYIATPNNVDVSEEKTKRQIDSGIGGYTTQHDDGDDL